MQESVESAGKFVVSGGDTPELLEAIEESPDEVSSLVSMPVNFALGVAIASRWDDRVGAGGLDDVDQGYMARAKSRRDDAGCFTA